MGELAGIAEGSLIYLLPAAAAGLPGPRHDVVTPGYSIDDAEAQPLPGKLLKCKQLEGLIAIDSKLVGADGLEPPTLSV